MENNKNFKQIKCTIGSRWTTGFNVSENKQMPNKNGKVIPTINSNLYDIVEQYIKNPMYGKRCQELANKHNEENNLTVNDKDYWKAKHCAKSIYAFNDYRYTKYDKVEIDGRVIRVLTNKSFLEHQGLMVFDIDFPKDTENLDDLLKEIKTKLFNELSQYKWFCMITLSTGGKGLHIYTYNIVPDYYDKNKNTSPRIAYFNSCYQYKSYYIYKALYKIWKDMYGEVSIDFILSLLDFAMYKPEQTTNITVYDTDPYINSNFECEICIPVVKNIENGYDNWIHKEGNALKPDAEAGWFTFNEAYCSISKFICDDKSYNIEKQSIHVSTKKANYKSPKDGPFYFGHNERHSGIPTIPEVCKYLLATRSYEEALMIVSDKKFSTAEDFPRYLTWFRDRDIKYYPSDYVRDWLNTFAGFKDEIISQEIDKDLLNFFDGFILDSKGRIDRDNIDNYIYYLNNFPLYKNMLKFNTLSHRNELLSKTFKKGEAMDYSMIDIDYVRISNNFNRHIHFLSKKLIEEAIDEVCQDNRYNPVVDYFESLKWDGVKRIETMTHDWLNAEDTPLYRRYNLLWMYAAVKRIYEPGCKWDNVLILQGKQGDGKTEFFKRLGKQWNISSKLNISNKDYINKLNKNWIIIMDELAALDKKEMAEIKSFFSNQDDDERLAFARNNEKYYRHCIFCGTVNQKGIARDTDDMYERRFWIIEINATDQTYVYNNFTDEEVDKLWAEAVHLYKENQNMSLYLGDEYINLAKKDQVQYKSFNNDDIITIIKEIFNKEYMFNVNDPTYNGSYYFTNYEDFKKQIECDYNNLHNNEILGVKTQIDIFDPKMVRWYCQEKYKETRQNKYIAFATEFDYRQIYRFGSKMFVRKTAE